MHSSQPPSAFIGWREGELLAEGAFNSIAVEDGRSQARAPVRFTWLVSPRYDLSFFVLSSSLTFIFYWLYTVMRDVHFGPKADRVLVTYLLFTALFDHPHIFQTFSRTHFDQDEFRKRRRLYTWGLAGFIAASCWVTFLGYEGELIVFAAVFGTWHIIRQHAGFLKLYKTLNADLEPIDNVLDMATFYTGMFACFFHDYGDIREPIVIYGKIKASFPSLPSGLGELVWSAFIALLVAWTMRQMWRLLEGKPLNGPKMLLMGVALITHYFVFFATATPFLIAEALETVYHDVQYQGFIMHYQRRRFVNMRSAVLRFFGCAILYGVLIGLLETFALTEHTWAVWAFAPFSAIVLFHYYVDGLVWRFRDYPQLSKLLLKRVVPPLRS